MQRNRINLKSLIFLFLQMKKKKKICIFQNIPVIRDYSKFTNIKAR